MWTGSKIQKASIMYMSTINTVIYNVNYQKHGLHLRYVEEKPPNPPTFYGKKCDLQDKTTTTKC